MEYKTIPPLTFRQALRKALTDCTRYGHRRVRRSEYWWCMLAIALYYGILFGLSALFEDIVGLDLTSGPATIVLTILCAIPVGLWVMENYGRLHDTNHRDTWLMGILIPVFILIFGCALSQISMGHYPILLCDAVVIVPLLAIAAAFTAICLIFCLRDSDRGENDYGPSPKYQSLDNECMPSSTEPTDTTDGSL